MDPRRRGTASWLILAGALVAVGLAWALLSGSPEGLRGLEAMTRGGSPAVFLMQAAACFVTGAVFQDFGM